jgi:hypothetical protein
VDRVSLASRLARNLAHVPGRGEAATGRASPVRVRVAVGDPQACLETFLEVLGAHGLLADDGRIRDDVELYSMGDHFDWGRAEDAERAGEDGLALLAWLASHSADRVHLVLGNHDLARVGELAEFDDATFREARNVAARVYAEGDAAAERELVKRFPALPTAEVAARDFASFTVAQRELVVSLLRARRFRVAFASDRQVLLTHAAVTSRDLVLGRPADAGAIAAMLNDRLDAAVASWTGGPLAIPGLHEPGSAARGEGGGIFYHRPTSDPVTPGNESRRFDPRELPRGITQVIGHIGDEKCRALMPQWSDGEPANGALRTLVTDGVRVRYCRGVQPSARGEARIVFTDGTMHRTPTGAYEILDLDAMAPIAPRLTGAPPAAPPGNR